MGVGKLYAPYRIRPERIQKFISRNLREDLWLTNDTCVGEHDVQPAILCDRLVDSGLHRGFIASVELPHVDVNTWIQ